MTRTLGRREFIKGVSLGAASTALYRAALAAPPPRKPNIVYILADDLGYAELGCYGQTKIRTPHIDRIAAEGMRFTQFYSGHAVCAPSRCALLTGLHTGHAYVRGNKEIGSRHSYQGQLPLPEGTETIATMLKRHGYATACIGKWGLGRAGSSGAPNRQGFDLFYGYNCQRHAHNYYPRYLERNGTKETLEGNDRKRTGRHYAADLMGEECLKFIRENASRPFFLYFATPVPHVALQVPADSLAEYADKFGDRRYNGKKGYLPHPKPRAAYAAMVTRMDRDVGRIMSLLKELGIDEKTLVAFTSDNGPTFNGGSDSAFFKSAGIFRGLKCSMYEGGIRVPFVARWPGRIAPGTVSDHVAAAWDIMPTIAAMTGTQPRSKVDGLSVLPTLTGRGTQEVHDHLYWENRRTQAVRMGDWKGVRTHLHKNPSAPLALYDLATDPSERTNVASKHPDVARRIIDIMIEGRTPSQHFKLEVRRPPGM